VLIEIGSNANFIYDKDYKINDRNIVDQLVIILITGQIEKQYIERKFIGLEKVIQNYELVYKS